MKKTHLPLSKFICDNKKCQFECFINSNNNVLTAYSPSVGGTLLDWICPECKKGNLRFGPTNVKFDFLLHKDPVIKPEEDKVVIELDPNAKNIDP